MSLEHLVAKPLGRQVLELQCRRLGESGGRWVGELSPGWDGGKKNDMKPEETYVIGLVSKENLEETYGFYHQIEGFPVDFPAKKTSQWLWFWPLFACLFYIF